MSPWLTARQAIGFLAFGRPLSDAELDAAIDPPPTHPWGRSDLGALLQAFQARAAGKPWRPIDWEPAFGARPIRARVRKIMRTTGLGAAQLADDLAADIARQEDANRRMRDATARLVDAARDEGRLRIEGRKGSRHSGKMEEQHTPIEARAFLRESIVITLDGWVTVDPAAPYDEWLHRRDAGAVDWGDLRLRYDDVVGLLTRGTADTPLPPEAKLSAEPPPRSEPKPVYSEKACELWFTIRVKRWPLDLPPPSQKMCLKAARDHFSGNVPRDPFREIRRRRVPENWQKSGPRGPRVR